MASEDDILKSAKDYFLSRQEEGQPDGPAAPEESADRSRPKIIEREVRVEGVYESTQGGGPFVLLKDAKGRNLPIFVGQEVAAAILLAIEGQAPRRPCTHDLIRALLDRLGGTIQSAVVDDLYKNVFYAKLVCRQGERQFEIDCRSSDAIAVALRCGASIFVAEHVLEEGQCPISDD